ncbi:MAG: carbohydrate ABC transporter permease [Oscillospiraceae bacterium]|mgnify:CR=1 FL=1|jgi:putative aldouronate transport system permease protein|nr:carbohydrate ABC transporter permease [Oscillospiraceae bacterium]
MKHATNGYKVFTAFNILFMIFVIVITLFPFIYMLAVSFSGNSAVLRGDVLFYPIDFTVTAYRNIMNDAQFWVGYRNTLIYTVGGTLISMAMTVACAYPLSKKQLPGRGPLLMFMVFTMYFGGGLIPFYLLVRSLHLINTVWAILVPGAISVYNMIVMKTFFEGIPQDIEEAAQIDGLSYIATLFKIVLPLSKPVIATITLFYAVGFWNDWFNAMIYLNSNSLYPVTLYLRNLLMGAQLAASNGQGITSGSEAAVVPQTLQAATVVLVTVPILCIYPFIQKYFVKGVMLGSIKG